MEVRLFATFREGRQKIMNIEHQEGMNGYTLLDILKIPEDEVAIFLINGHHNKLSAILNEEDIIALFPPVGGG